MSLRIAGCAMVLSLSSLEIQAAAAPGCLPHSRVPITVRIAESAAVSAWLEGGFETALVVRGAATGQTLWSAGHASHVIQQFAGMDAGFAAGIAAVDLNADGLHDRIYAGDTAGRLWRFDVQHGAEAAHWLAGGVWADFSNAEGRGFLAPPDISLSRPPAAEPWLNIAIGTAAPGNADANNRFYALRDHDVGSWSQADYDAWQPWTESDLHRVRVTEQASGAQAGGESGHPGWYIELGRGHVVTPSLTVQDRAVLAVAETLPNAAGPCEVFARVLQLDLRQPSAMPGGAPANAGGRLPTPLSLPAAFELQPGRAGRLQCFLGDQHIEECDLDLPPVRTWWRREDAP